MLEYVETEKERVIECQSDGSIFPSQDLLRGQNMEGWKAPINNKRELVIYKKEMGGEGFWGVVVRGRMQVQECS